MKTSRMIENKVPSSSRSRSKSQIRELNSRTTNASSRSNSSSDFENVGNSAEDEEPVRRTTRMDKMMLNRQLTEETRFSFGMPDYEGVRATTAEDIPPTPPVKMFLTKQTTLDRDSDSGSLRSKPSTSALLRSKLPRTPLRKVIATRMRKKKLKKMKNRPQMILDPNFSVSNLKPVEEELDAIPGNIMMSNRDLTSSVHLKKQYLDCLKNTDEDIIIGKDGKTVDELLRDSEIQERGGYEELDVDEEESDYEEGGDDFDETPPIPPPKTAAMPEKNSKTKHHRRHHHHHNAEERITSIPPPPNPKILRQQTKEEDKSFVMPPPTKPNLLKNANPEDKSFVMPPPSKPNLLPAAKMEDKSFVMPPPSKPFVAKDRSALEKSFVMPPPSNPPPSRNSAMPPPSRPPPATARSTMPPPPRKPAY